MRTRIAIKFLLAGLAACLLVSCATTAPPGVQTKSPPPVWPPAPNQPRIRFMRNLHGPADIGQRPGLWTTVAGWLTGDKGERFNLRKPFAVALDEHGNLCLTDMDAKRVCYLDFTHKKWRNYTGVGSTKFLSPVAVARRNGIFYVADSRLGKVFAFHDNDKSVFTLGSPLKRPVGLAIASNSLYVVDSEVHAIFVYSLDGKFEFRFGKRGTGPGEFNFPTCAATDGRGHLIVSDTLNSRVQIFDLQGHYLSQFGSNGDTSGHFARPKGVAVDSDGHIYVVDELFGNVQIFNATGQLLLNFGENGDGPGQFALPNGIAIGRDNRIFIADAFNHRVQVFKYLEP